MTQDALYNSIFHITSERLDVLDVRVRLIEMDSQVWGLGWDDPRREHVLFWIEAAINKEEKCNLQDEHLIASRLQAHKNYALEEVEKQGHQDLKGRYFNLETYANDLRTERLLFCEFRIGKYFMQQLEHQSADSLAEVDRLANIYQVSGKSSVYALGRWIGDLIGHNMDQSTHEELSQSEDRTIFVRDLFYRLSACSHIIEVTREFNTYYGLLLFAGDYPHMSQKLKSWLERVSACMFIGESDQVFKSAAVFLLGNNNAKRKLTKTRSLKKIMKEADGKGSRSVASV